MVVSTLIILVSCALLFYWFRYVCVLILSTGTSRDYARDVAAENGLSFLHLPDQLADVPMGELDYVARSLQQDYDSVTFLLKQAAQLEIGGVTVDQLILRLDFLLMRARYLLSRQVSTASARDAVDEMRQVVAHLANGYGEQAVGVQN